MNCKYSVSRDVIYARHKDTAVVPRTDWPLGRHWAGTEQAYSSHLTRQANFQMYMCKG